MKIGTSTKKLAIIAGVLGVCGLGFLAPSASARPKHEKTEVRNTHTVVRTHTDNRHRPEEQTTRTTRTVVQTRPVVPTRTIVRNKPVYHTRTIVRDRPVYQTRTVVRNRPVYGTRYRTRPSTYNGSVAFVSGGRIGINVGGNVYSVFSSNGLPRGLNRGDYVRVVGVRTGGSIRNARVYMVRNY